MEILLNFVDIRIIPQFWIFYRKGQVDKASGRQRSLGRLRGSIFCSSSYFQQQACNSHKSLKICPSDSKINLSCEVVFFWHIFHEVGRRSVASGSVLPVRQECHFSHIVISIYKMRKLRVMYNFQEIHSRFWLPYAWITCFGSWNHKM